jgi:hypothetical protein
MRPDVILAPRRFSRLYLLRLICLLAVIGHSAPAAAQTATATALRAIRVRETIRIQLRGRTLHVGVDRRPGFPELKKNQVFVTSGPVTMTFYRLNPLRHQVSADVTDADDPSHATMAKLVETLLGMAAAIRLEDQVLKKVIAEVQGAGLEKSERAKLFTAEEGCEPLNAAIQLVGTLHRALYDPAWSGVTVKEQVKAWSEAIDTAHAGLSSGMTAGGAAIAKIDGYLKPVDPDMPALTALIADAEAAVRALNAALKDMADASEPCAVRAKAIYEGLRLADPERRLAEIKRIHASVTAVRKLLQDTYTDTSNWQGSGDGEFKHEFIVRRGVEPSSAKMQVVTVKVIALDFSQLDPFVPEVIARREDLVSGTFTVQQHSMFVPEIGVGATFAYVERPKFGTAMNDAGQTVVAVTAPDRYTVDPSVLVNFVCRCGPAPLLTPMIQIGGSTSKETPALFLGGGVRLFHTGAGDFAFGAGWVVPWVRQLKTLHVNDVVEGTAEIEADLELRPLAAKNFYWSLQYKF